MATEAGAGVAKYWCVAILRNNHKPTICWEHEWEEMEIVKGMLYQINYHQILLISCRHYYAINNQIKLTFPNLPSNTPFHPPKHTTAPDIGFGLKPRHCPCSAIFVGKFGY